MMWQSCLRSKARLVGRPLIRPRCRLLSSSALVPGQADGTRQCAVSSKLCMGAAGSACLLAVGLGSAGCVRADPTDDVNVKRKFSAGVPKGRTGWVVTPLLDRVAIVTGSSQGIGAGIATEMAWAGADICVNYVGDRRPAEEVAQKIRQIGRRAVIVEADVSDRAAIERMFDIIEKELGPVNILVTNAVTSKRQSLLEMDVVEFERTLKIGLFGVFHCMQVFSQRQVAQGKTGGSIVHISSPHAKGPFKDAVDYNVAKAGSHHLALSAANDLMWNGIRVNMVQPGWTYTEGELRLYSQEVLDRSGPLMPLGRLGMPEDVGKAAVWLCSEEAAYVTGANIVVDGGQFIETAPSWNSAGRHGVTVQG